MIQDAVAAETGLDERRVIEAWREAGLFQAPHVVVDDDVEALIPPPPSPNGRLHVGHALNLALQDSFTRVRPMRLDAPVN
jgi:valyl-tRNA synthetase